MRARLLTGDATQIENAMQACHRQTTVALVVTVANVVDQTRVVNTMVEVTGGGFDNAAQIATSANGVFTIIVEELQADLVAGDANYVVATTDGADSYALQFAPIAPGADGNAPAYFGALYELTLLRGDQAVPGAANRDGRFSIRPGGGGNVWIDAGDALSLADDYKLAIADNYSLTDADDSLLGEAGDATSKPADYQANGWTQHISPAVPLCVRVRKKRAGAYAQIVNDEVVVRWSVIDPPPTFAPEAEPRAPQKPTTFLQAVYASLRGQQQPPPGHANKNCPVKFGGARENDGRVNASSVLYTAAGGWQALAAADVTDATSAVVPDANDATLADSDVFFAPPPIGGDSYRFNIQLRNANGNALRFVTPPQTDPLTEVETGIITMWREVTISAVVQLDVEDMTIWDEVEAAYAAAYILIKRSDPLNVNQSSIEHRVLQVVGHNHGAWPEGNLLPVLYESENAIYHKIHQVVSEIVASVIENNQLLPDPNQPPPGGAGLYVVVCRNLYEGSNGLGLYMGAAQLFSVLIRDYTSTLIHELGHALYLRHCLAAKVGRRKPANGWNGASDTLFHIAPNDYWLDHDPRDAVSCILSYICDFHTTDPGDVAVQTHFCGLCLLKLRMWDTVLMRNDAAFAKSLRDGYAAQVQQIVLVHDPDRGNACWNLRCLDCWNCRPAAGITIPAGNASSVRALVLPDATHNNFDWESWIDLTARGQWTSSNTDAATVDAAGTLTAVAAGNANIQFTFNDLQVTAAVTVGPAPSAFDAIHKLRLRVGDWVNADTPPANEVDAETFVVQIENEAFVACVHGGKYDNPNRRVFYLTPNGGDGSAVMPTTEIPLPEGIDSDWKYTVTETRFHQEFVQTRYGDENLDVDVMRFRRPNGTIGTVRRRP